MKVLFSNLGATAVALWLTAPVTPCHGVTAEDSARQAFEPGKVWLDTDGRPIQAHSAGILHHDGVYYWYGEDKTLGNLNRNVPFAKHFRPARAWQTGRLLYLSGRPLESGLVGEIDLCLAAFCGQVGRTDCIGVAGAVGLVHLRRRTVAGGPVRACSSFEF